MYKQHDLLNASLFLPFFFLLTLNTRSTNIKYTFM